MMMSTIVLRFILSDVVAVVVTHVVRTVIAVVQQGADDRRGTGNDGGGRRGISLHLSLRSCQECRGREALRVG